MPPDALIGKWQMCETKGISITVDNRENVTGVPGLNHRIIGTSPKPEFDYYTFERYSSQGREYVWAYNINTCWGQFITEENPPRFGKVCAEQVGLYDSWNNK